MNQNLLRLTWLIGLTAMLMIAGIHSSIALPLGFAIAKDSAGKISFFIVLAIAGLTTFKMELAQRSKSEPWTVYSMLAFGFAYLVGNDVYLLLPFFLARLFHFLEHPVAHTLTALGLAFFLFKSAGELSPLVESENRESGLGRRIIFGLTIFIGVSVEFIPSSWLPGMKLESLVNGEFNSGPVWPVVVQWILAFAAATVLVSKVQIAERIDPDRPGLSTLRIGVVLIILLNVLGMLAGMITGVLGRGVSLVALIGLLVAFSPIAIAAKWLLTFGALRLLLNLQPAAVASQSVPHDIASAAAPVIQPVVEPSTSSTGTHRSMARESTPAPEALADPNPIGDLEKEHELRAAIANDPMNVRLHERLHRALAADSIRSKDLLQHAREYLAVLIGHSKKAEALALLRECLALDPNFKPAADQIWPMVRILHQEKDPKTSLRLMSRFDVDNPGHPHTPQIFYLCARTLASLNQIERAKQLIHVLVERFPADKAAQDAKTMLASMRES